MQSDLKPIFTDFYEQNLSRVVSHIEKKIGSHQDAEDLASEVFAYCYAHYEDYDPQKSAILTWLYLVVNSRIKNYYRARRTFVPIDSMDQYLADEQIDMEHCIYLEQVQKQLHLAIQTLDERSQQAIILRYFQNCSGREIAARLGTTAGNARVILNRALKQLEKQCGNLLKGSI